MGFFISPSNLKKIITLIKGYIDDKLGLVSDTVNGLMSSSMYKMLKNGVSFPTYSTDKLSGKVEVEAGIYATGSSAGSSVEKYLFMEPASTTKPGVMSADDKAKLDSIYPIYKEINTYNGSLNAEANTRYHASSIYYLEVHLPKTYLNAPLRGDIYFSFLGDSSSPMNFITDDNKVIKENYSLVSEMAGKYCEVICSWCPAGWWNIKLTTFE